MKHGKKYNELKKLVDATKRYELTEAVELAKKTSYSKFVGSVELHVNTSADPRYNDQIIRGTTVLPHGNGKVVKVAVFASEDKFDEAKKAGADVVGKDDLIKDIEAGNINFDTLVTTPDMMRDLARVAKALGPKGLMPSPKAGTVTPDLAGTISEIKKGRIEYKLDKGGNFHIVVGKADFDTAKIVENIQSLLKVVEENKPSGVKGKLFNKVVVTTTMGVGVAIDLNS